MRHARGFTLVELIAVLVMVSIGAVTLAGLFGNANFAALTAERAQHTAQIAQECAEYLVSLRLDTNFAAMVDNNNCDVLGIAAGGYVRTDVLGPIYTAATSPMCPAGARCRNAVITVNNGDVASVLTVLLAE